MLLIVQHLSSDPDHGLCSLPHDLKMHCTLFTFDSNWRFKLLGHIGPGVRVKACFLLQDFASPEQLAKYLLYLREEFCSVTLLCF